MSSIFKITDKLITNYSSNYCLTIVLYQVSHPRNNVIEMTKLLCLDLIADDSPLTWLFSSTS